MPFMYWYSFLFCICFYRLEVILSLNELISTEKNDMFINEYVLDPLITNLLKNHFDEPWENSCNQWKEKVNVSCERSVNFFEESALSKRSLTLMHSGSSSHLLSSLNFLRFQQFLSKFTDRSKSGDDIVIAVLGGSMTAGRGVGVKHAWPSKLQDFLEQELFKHHKSTNVKVLNLATPATSLLWVLNRLGPTLPNDVNIDLVIVDYDVNDCAFMYDDKISRIRVQSATELAIRKVLSLVHPVNNSSPLKGPAIAFSNVAVNHQGRSIHMDCHSFPTCYSIGDIRNVIASVYAVPVISQKYSLWQDVACDPPGNLWTCSKFCSHPLHGAHMFMATLFMKFFFETSYVASFNWEGETLSWGKKKLGQGGKTATTTTLKRMTSVEDHPYVQYMLASFPNYLDHLPIPDTPILPETKLLEDAICSRIGTMYDSVQLFQERNSNPSSSGIILSQRSLHVIQENTQSLGIIRSNSSCWDLSEDVVGKAGWITLGEGCVNSTITFAVSFGEHPVLSISYLTSWTPDMGMMEFRMSKVPVRMDIAHSSPSSSSPSSKEMILHRKDEVLKFIENEDNFNSLQFIDGLRVQDEYFTLSVSEVVVIIPEDGRALMDNREFNEKLVPRDWMLSNSTYWIQMKSIDANNEIYYSKKMNGAIRDNSKFKLYSVSSC